MTTPPKVTMAFSGRKAGIPYPRFDFDVWVWDLTILLFPKATYPTRCKEIGLSGTTHGSHIKAHGLQPRNMTDSFFLKLYFEPDEDTHWEPSADFFPKLQGRKSMEGSFI